MIKLAFIITGLGRGGAEKMLVKLISLMNKRDFTPKVFCLTNKIDLVPDLQTLGIDVYTYNLNHPLYMIPSLVKFIRDIRQFSPHITQGWMYHGNIFAWIAHCFINTKLIFGIRASLYDFNYESKITQWIIRLGAYLSSKSDGIIYVAHSAQQQHETIGYNRENSQIIANGFDFKTFESSAKHRQESRHKFGLESTQLAIGYFARFHKLKGHSDLIQAFATVHKSYPKTQLILAGLNVDERNVELNREITKFGLQNHVQLLGQLSHPEVYLPALDLFVSPSLQEGFPNVVGEAMACGVPCVVTNVGDSALAVGDTGLVVPAKDPKALAKAMIELLEQPNKLVLLGQNAATRIETEFALPAIVQKYESAYKKFVEVS